MLNIAVAQYECAVCNRLHAESGRYRKGKLFLLQINFLFRFGYLELTSLWSVLYRNDTREAEAEMRV